MESTRSNPQPLLQIRNLKTHFFTRSGGVKAVNDVSFEVMPGETLGWVGESGSGKTITVTSVLKLLPRGARILEGEIIFEGENLLHKTEKEMAEVRGKRIGLILQNSMTALDPVFTIGTQIAEPLVIHKKMSWTESFREAIDLLRRVKIGAPEIRVNNLTLLQLYGFYDMVVCMKTTVEITDTLLEEVKKVAATEHTTVRALIEEGLRRVVGERQQRTAFRLRRASFGGQGLRADVQDGSWQQIRALAYEGRGT
jgi:ABC-type microcin C transport system duplicated ATPase subunit YejF